MLVLDRMTRIVQEIPRLGTTIHPNVAIGTFVRHLPSDYSFVKQSLEGQEPDREEILEQMKARHNFCRSQSSESASVAKGNAVEKGF